MCATSKSTSAAIAASGVIAFVVKFLRHGSNRQKQRAAGALLNLSENSDNITSIAAAGAIRPLVKLLEDGTDNQKTAAVGAIRNLARNSHNKTKIMEAGAVDPLLKILSGDNYDLIKAAAGALWNLSVASGNTVLHAMAKSFEDFVLPDIPDGRNVEYVTAVVYTSANGHFNRNQNQDFLLIAIMILFFACVSLAIIVLVMIVVLVRVIIMALPILVCLGGIVLFVHVLSLQDTMDVHKEAAAYALSNLAENSDSNKASIAAAGAIDPLVKMLRDGTEGQKVAAAGALRNLAVNSDIKVLIAQAGAI